MAVVRQIMVHTGTMLFLNRMAARAHAERVFVCVVNVIAFLFLDLRRGVAICAIDHFAVFLKAFMLCLYLRVCHDRRGSEQCYHKKREKCFFHTKGSFLKYKWNIEIFITAQ